MTEKPPSPAMQPIKAFIKNLHSVANRLTTTTTSSCAALNCLIKRCVLVQVGNSGWVYYFSMQGDTDIAGMSEPVTLTL